jgi:DNA-binding transcriptional MerR regulator
MCAVVQNADPVTGPDLKIAEVSRRSGCSVSALRYYEQAGLLPPTPRLGGQRVYPAHVLARLEVITALRAAGFGIAEIRLVLDSKQKDESVQVRARRVLAALESLSAEIEQKRAALEQARHLLASWQDELSALADLD